MKVLYLTNLPAPYRVSFFNELGKHVELTVLYERKNADDRDTRWTGDAACNFQEVYLGGVHAGPASAISGKVLSYIKDPSYDIRIISGYSSPTAMLAIGYMKRKKIPYILSIDGGFPAAENKWKKALKSYFVFGASLYLSTGKNADRYLCHYGADIARICRYHFTSLFEKDMLSAPVTAQEKAHLKKQLGMNPEKKAVLSVGRLLRLKRHDLVIRAAESFPDTEFYIAGGEPDSYHQALLDASSAKNVQFIDFMPYQRLALFYQAADVFLMPSESDIWGLVLLEAMANGLPAVATSGCGAAEDLITHGENGYIAPKGDLAAICSHLSVLLSANSGTYGAKSLEIIKEYTIENEVRDHLNTFHRFLRG